VIGHSDVAIAAQSMQGRNPDEVAIVVRRLPQVDSTHYPAEPLAIDPGQFSADLLKAVVAIQRQFIIQIDPQRAFEEALKLLLELTGSEYGFIGEVLQEPQAMPYLKTCAISDIAWDEPTREFYAKNAPQGMEFRNLYTLFGEVIRTGNAVIANEPSVDPRSGGLPAGHPSLDAFVGLPFYFGDDRLVGITGLANRPGGYNQDLVKWLQPLCDALGVIIVAFQHERRRREAEAELEQREAAMRQSEARYRTFVDHATDGLFLHDCRGRIVDVNRQACESLGYTREELIGKLPSDFDVVETFADQRDLLRRLEAGETIAFDSWHLRKDGTTFPVEVRIRPFWVDGQRFGLALARDITKRKQAENALRESEERFRVLVEASAQAVWETGPHGEIVADSPSWRAYTGQTVEEWLCDRWIDAVHPEDREYAYAQWQAALRDNGFVDAEFRIRRADGSWRWTRVRAAPLLNPDGSVRKWAGMNTDITERKQTEEKLLQQRDQLELVTRLCTLGEMTAGIAHELNQPLTAIANYSFLATQCLEGDKAVERPRLRETCQILHRQALRAGEIVKRWRGYVKGTSPKQIHVDVNSIIDESLQFVQPHLRTEGVEVRREYADDLPSVLIDAIQIQQVIVNLVCNSIFAMQETSRSERRLIVTTRMASVREVEIVVEDNGRGIDDGEIGSIFDPFYTTKSDGMGLGLTICRSIIEAHSGQLTCESVEPRGAAFRFRLPVSIVTSW
jgi:PAS domain S-box-containing protein